MKRVTLLIFLVAGFVPAAAAQEHGQVGVFAEYYKLKKTNTDFGGLGGRFAINYRRSVAFEAEMGYDFEQVFTESFTSGTGTVQFVRSNIDRKSTRLNSSHLVISYAVFCLKKKKLRKPAPSH